MHLHSPPSLSNLLQNFNPISLVQLNNKAELMTRRDNKYVLTNEQIKKLLSYTQSQFDVLEIGGLRQFHYLSKYFDSEELHTHQAHNKGRRRRIKIRHRHYVDSDRHYFEIKLKGFRNLTQKLRVPFNPSDVGENGLNNELLSFCKATVTDHYTIDWLFTSNDLTPSISVGYDRITLVSKSDDKRITIDNKIYFIDESTKQQK